MKKIYFRLFTAVVFMFSMNVTMSHAENYKLCGSGKQSKCYTESQAKGKKNCNKTFSSAQPCFNAMNVEKKGMWYICGWCHKCEKYFPNFQALTCDGQKFSSESSCQAAAKAKKWTTGSSKPC